MGKPTDGTNAGFGDLDPNPFPIDRAPQVLIVSFSGIERTLKGEADGSPPSPNKNFYPEPEGPEFHFNDDDWFLDIFGDLSYCDLWSKTPPPTSLAFRYTDPEGHVCFAGDNSLLDPLVNRYVGGQMSITWMDHYGPDSAFFLMDAFGLRRGPPVMLEQIPQPGQKAVSRFADQRDGTCIRIMLDKNWGVFLPRPRWTYNAETQDLYLWLTFPKMMNNTSTPLPGDFVLCTLYGVDIPAYSCVWYYSNVIRLHFSVPVKPTEENWLDYTKGINPLKYEVSGEYASWNHMFLPAETL